MSSQQRSAAGEEVLGLEGEVGQRGQVSTASCRRRARVQGLDLNPGRFHKQSGGLPIPPCPPSVVPPAPGMREQPAEASSQHRTSWWEYSGIMVLFTRMLRALCWDKFAGAFGIVIYAMYFLLRMSCPQSWANLSTSGSNQRQWERPSHLGLRVLLG